MSSVIDEKRIRHRPSFHKRRHDDSKIDVVELLIGFVIVFILLSAITRM